MLVRKLAVHVFRNWLILFAHLYDSVAVMKKIVHLSESMYSCSKIFSAQRPLFPQGVIFESLRL
jgi:hypothetical protein